MNNFIALSHSPSILILISLAIGYAAGRLRVYQLQNQGEAAVRRTITKAFGAPDYHLLNNVTLPTHDGTTQVDHVLISRFGVFVIETKHYSGKIYCNPSSPTWTQFFVKTSFKFQNPIFQNKKHVAAVRSLLAVPPNAVHSVVVFTGSAVFMTARPQEVFLLGELVNHIRRYDTEEISLNQLESFVGRIECHRQALTRQTDVQHREHLKRKFG